MGRGVRALVALVVAGMLALTGCAGQNPSNAATVGGVAITEDRVSEVALALATAAGAPDAAGSQRLSAAANLVRNQVGLQVGQQSGVTVGEADVQAAIDSAPQFAQMAADPALTGFIHDLAVFQLTVMQMGEAEFIAAASEVDVNLNPRYGAWDPAVVSITGESGSLSIPASNASTNA